jgi:hypothetical protein
VGSALSAIRRAPRVTDPSQHSRNNHTTASLSSSSSSKSLPIPRPVAETTTATNTTLETQEEEYDMTAMSSKEVDDLTAQLKQQQAVAGQRRERQNKVLAYLEDLALHKKLEAAQKQKQEVS